MKTVGNVLWLILCGLWSFVAWALIGALLCVTIIGIPFGVQCFKLAAFSLWPFGRSVVHERQRGRHVLGNVVWLLVAGLWITIAYMLTAALLFVSIIGIPFGVQAMKLAGLSVWPFGAHFVGAGAGSSFVISSGGPTPEAGAGSADSVRRVPPTTSAPALPPMDP